VWILYLAVVNFMMPQVRTALDAMAIAEPLLSFIGIIVLIIGGIFLVKYRIKRKKAIDNNSRNKSDV
jgi:hypothetical protein